MKLSFETLKPDLLMATLFYIVVAIVGEIGSVACGIGVLFSLPLFFLSICIAYRDYFIGPPAGASPYAPPPGAAGVDVPPPPPPAPPAPKTPAEASGADAPPPPPPVPGTTTPEAATPPPSEAAAETELPPTTEGPKE